MIVREAETGFQILVTDIGREYAMDLKLQGKMALVTGGSEGIGKGIALALAKEGVDVAICARRKEPLEAAAKEIAQATGRKIVPIAADLRKDADAKTFIEQGHKALGRVDILVNNAGIQHVAPIEQFPVDKWNAILALNLSAAFHTIRTALPSMKEAGFGRIINVASAHSLVASPFKSAYVAAKHGVLGLTKTVALEAARSGVTVNAVCPGYVWTPLVEKQIDDTAKARGITRDEVINNVLLAAQPSKRFATVEELGELAVFLSSPAAASITGTAISVDGGWTAQ